LDRVIALRSGPGEPGPVAEGTIGTGHAPALFPPIVSNPHTPTLGGRILPEQTRPCMRWTVCHGPRCGQTGASMRLPTGRQGAQCGRAYRFSSLPPFSDLGGHHCPPGPRFSGSGGHHLPELAPVDHGPVVCVVAGGHWFASCVWSSGNVRLADSLSRSK
jgi:hypothetical protein